MRRRALVLLLLVPLLLPAIAAAQTNIFILPQLQPRHAMLVQEMRQAMRQRNSAAMERVCRAGTALLPDDPTWHYNLACALAQQARPDEALDELERAVTLGFRDAAAIGRDSDLAALRALPRFESLLDLARRTAGEPVPGRPVVRPAAVEERGALVSPGNTVWDFDLGYFQSYFLFPTDEPATNALVKLDTPAGQAVRRWEAEGTAAGNAGDLYDNRDRGHSRLDLQSFPALTPIVYGEEALEQRVDYALSRFLFFGGPVIGNSSTAQTAGPFWCSNPRQAYADGRGAALMALQYYRNHLYFYPSHRDYDATVEGDVYPAHTPYVVIAQGSSGSDQLFMQAVACTLAAFRPEVKHLLVQQGQLMPTVQYILRASQRSVKKRDDYLNGAAHRAACSAAQLDPLRMVNLAHSFETNNLPPLLALRVAEEPQVIPGRDFFDVFGSELLFDTPGAIARVVRGMSYRRRLVVDARAARDIRGRPLTWHWVVLQGDPGKVRITPRQADGAVAEIEVAYPGGRFPVEAGAPATSNTLMTARVDVGVFVDNGEHYSAPAYVSFTFLNNEERQYTVDGRILSVDYAVAAGRYTDPRLSLPRRWRDLYLYDEQNRMIGWTRQRGDGVETFTADGARVETRDDQGRPLTARTVQYLPRSPGDRNSLPEVVQVDGDTLRRYRYATPDTRVAELVEERPAAAP